MSEAFNLLQATARYNHLEATKDNCIQDNQPGWQVSFQEAQAEQHRLDDEATKRGLWFAYVDEQFVLRAK